MSLPIRQLYQPMKLLFIINDGTYRLLCCLLTEVLTLPSIEVVDALFPPIPLPAVVPWRAQRRLSTRSTARLSRDVLDRLSTSTNESSLAVAATTGVGAAGLRCREGDRRLPASRALHQGGGQIGDRSLKRLAVSSILIVYLHRWWPRRPTPRRDVAGRRAPSSV